MTLESSTHKESSILSSKEKTTEQKFEILDNDENSKVNTENQENIKANEPSGINIVSSEKEKEDKKENNSKSKKSKCLGKIKKHKKHLKNFNKIITSLDETMKDKKNIIIKFNIFFF